MEALKLPEACPFPEDVRKAIELMLPEMKEDPGPVWPRLLTYFNDGKLEWAHIDPGMMADWRDKNKVAGMIVDRCFRADARCAVFLSDCFQATPPPGKTFADMPRDFAEWPKHLTRESLLVTINARGIKGVFLNLAYTRGDGDQRLFASEAEIPTYTETNRFAFDLRDTSKLAAAIEAMTRGRDGHVVPNA